MPAEAQTGGEACASAGQGVALMGMLDAILRSADERREVPVQV